MAARSTDWNEAVTYWSRVGELGMEAALRESGCSEQRIVETLSLVVETLSLDKNDGKCHNLDKLGSLTDPDLGRAEVLATLGRDQSHDISRIEYAPSTDKVWTMSIVEAAALSVNLSSNNKIKHLSLSRCEVIGTVEGCTLLGNALATNSVLEKLVLSDVGMGSEGVRCLVQGLQSNKTLNKLILSGNPLLDEGVSCLAGFLVNNATINFLNLIRTGSSVEGAKHMSSVLVSNTNLKELRLGVDYFGRESMTTLLQPLSLDAGEDGMNSRIPKNISLETLGLIGPQRECVESVSHMIRTNKSLRCLQLREVTRKSNLAPLLPTDWKEKVFPALKENDTLRELDLEGIDGLIGEEVYESLMDLIQNSNTGLGKIDVSITGLESRQGQINEELRINKEYRSPLKGQPQMTTSSGRVVLCGYGFAGKTEISKTMKRIEHGSSYGHSLKMAGKKLMQSHPAVQRILLGKDAHKELTARTRGFEVVALKKQPYLKSIWDFAGQKEYYALHDYVFPNVRNSCFLYVCSCREPPDDDSDPRGKIKDEIKIRNECEYWLRFLASNSKPDAGSHGRHLPRVTFVLTKIDTLLSPGRIISIAADVVRDLKQMFKDVLNLCEVVEVVNAHSSTDVQRLLTSSNNNLEEILADQTEYIVCEQVRNLLEGWSRANLLKPVLGLEDFYKLCQEAGQEKLKFDQLSEDGWKIVLAYLNDLGEVIFSKDTDFIVTNPSWFGIDVLGSLINAFKGADHRQTGLCSAWTGAFCSRQQFWELYHRHGWVWHQDMEDHLERSLQSMHLKQSIPTKKLIDLMIRLEMCFQNHEREETHSLEFFMPALFDDEKETAAKGKRQLEWLIVQPGHLEYLGRRLNCENASTTFLTPGFFPRLQVHLWNYIHKQGWIKSRRFKVERNLICFVASGVEVCVEYAGDTDYFIDILVRSSEPYAEAVNFIKKHVVEIIRTFCASPQGCQGVDLVESVIRPACVRELHLCIERKAHSILVSELEDQLAANNAYKHTWSQGIEDVSDTDRALNLLKGDGSYERIRCNEGLQVPSTSNSTAAGVSSSSTYDALPTLIYPTIEDVGVFRRVETRLNVAKVIPIRLHLLCDHKDGSHKVEGQRGRALKLNASARGVNVPLVKLAITLLWAGVGVGASMVGGSVALPQVDKLIGSWFNVPELPGLDGETVYQMMNNHGHRSETVSEKEILKALERYWKGDSRTQGLREILKLDDGTSFWNDFQLRKVVYTEAGHENRVGWVCDTHFWNGYKCGILRSETH